MTDLMKKKLDEFLAERTSMTVDRSTYHVCALKDTANKITVCLIFVRDWHIDSESEEYRRTVIDGNGVVFTLPAYWLCVPKELVEPFLMYIINEYYKDELGISDGDGSSTGGGDGTGTGTQGRPPFPPPSGPCNCPVLNN